MTDFADVIAALRQRASDAAQLASHEQIQNQTQLFTATVIEMMAEGQRRHGLDPAAMAAGTMAAALGLIQQACAQNRTYAPASRAMAHHMVDKFLAPDDRQITDHELRGAVVQLIMQVRDSALAADDPVRRFANKLLASL